MQPLRRYLGDEVDVGLTGLPKAVFHQRSQPDCRRDYITTAMASVLTMQLAATRCRMYALGNLVPR